MHFLQIEIVTDKLNTDKDRLILFPVNDVKNEELYKDAKFNTKQIANILLKLTTSYGERYVSNGYDIPQYFTVIISCGAKLDNGKIYYPWILVVSFRCDRTNGTITDIKITSYDKSVDKPPYSKFTVKDLISDSYKAVHNTEEIDKHISNSLFKRLLTVSKLDELRREKWAVGSKGFFHGFITTGGTIYNSEYKQLTVEDIL